MAITNHDRVGRAMELLKDGLVPFVERELKSQHAQNWLIEAKASVSDTQTHLFETGKDPRWDVASLLSVMWRQWQEVFRKTLGQAERSLLSELRDVRNKWAHQEAFTSDDAYRALDSVGRLLAAVSAPQSMDLDKMRMELLRVRYDEQVRTEKRKSAGTAISSQAVGLRPWREVVSPHRDVASGRYQQAEFAADLWQVHVGEGSDEYKNPVEFFRRTYLTESLKRLLVGAVQRVTSGGGDPVVQLQTNFGGGKTHSMLALYHLFSGISPSDLPGIEEVMQEAGVAVIPAVRRVVLVGNKISPGNPVTKPDGTVVRTLWGEIAWQLGGRAAFERVRADDEKATSPGDALRELFNEHGPCLVLMDEWVAYARQLHDESTLPAGTFDTQFTFAQLLTESAKLAPRCLLLISLPASDTATSPHAQADDAEVGGIRGREALSRLQNVIGRVESSWRPASAEEGFEIVRRRLFEPLVDNQQFKARDTVAKGFYDYYRTQKSEFPSECGDADYEKRLKAAYPIHPEIFDRLYRDWSTLVKFQRTRGVLRLMAAVIHSLWAKGDTSPLILPSSIPIDDARVQFELTRYLPDAWQPIIARDVDGPDSLPLRLDGEVPSLGKYSASRRVARTIYLGSAPTQGTANRGLDDRMVKLGCAMPGESASVFGDALRRLSGMATYLYHDGVRYWYSTQPTVTKMAADRAEDFKRNTDAFLKELDRRLRAEVKAPGDFSRVHPLPQTGQDVQDDMEAKLVLLGPEHPYGKEENCPAVQAATAIMENRGNAPRIYRNTMAYLAADKSRLQDLEEAVCLYLAWKSIVDEKNDLNLAPSQVKQAEAQLRSADGVVQARVPETYQWLLAPVQSTPQVQVTWEVYRLAGQDHLAVRAGKKLKDKELLFTSFAPTRLRMELDKVPLWRGDHVEVRQVPDDFARYLYLPRLKTPSVLLDAVNSGPNQMVIDKDGFAYADGFDEALGRYRGLLMHQPGRVVDPLGPGLLVKPEVARRQLQAETTEQRGSGALGDGEGSQPGDGAGTPGAEGEGAGPESPRKPTRFHGAVSLDPDRVGRDAGSVSEAVIAHLTGLLGADGTVTLEIEVTVPSGVPENVVRTVTENCRTLKFTTHGFEVE
jgi:hypothetical protein